MDVDFSQIQDLEDYLSVPEGRYPCRIAEVREGVTRDGDVRWTFRLEVREGEFAGRTAAWDGISWSDRGLRRAKFVLRAFGFDTSGRLELEPGDLVGLDAWVEVQAEERQDPASGVRAVRPKVPYLGYADGPDGFEVVKKGA
jgi:hypothetical protein